MFLQVLVGFGIDLGFLPSVRDAVFAVVPHALVARAYGILNLVGIVTLALSYRMSPGHVAQSVSATPVTASALQ